MGLHCGPKLKNNKTINFKDTGYFLFRVDLDGLTSEDGPENIKLYEPLHNKTCLQHFSPSPTSTGLYSLKRRLEA